MISLWEWFARTFPNLYLALMFRAIPGSRLDPNDSKETDDDT